jgi:hypothetical protein
VEKIHTRHALSLKISVDVGRLKSQNLVIKISSVPNIVIDGQ